MDKVRRPTRVEVLDRRTVYRGYFHVERYRLRHDLYRGGMGRALTREVLDRGHAVAVLPYDPMRDEVVLIEQFRIGAFAMDASADPWLLEIVAGIVHAGEGPENVARREALEEAGLEISDLRPVARFFGSPGALTEHFEVFCGRVSSDGAGGIHGLAEEGEDIRVVVERFDEAMALLDAGRVRMSAAVVALQWLALNRDALRSAWR